MEYLPDAVTLVCGAAPRGAAVVDDYEELGCGGASPRYIEGLARGLGTSYSNEVGRWNVLPSPLRNGEKTLPNRLFARDQSTVLPNEATDRRVLRNLGCLERAPRREPLSALLDSQGS
jgi:hypothetical protein